MKRLCVIIMLMVGCWELLTAQVYRVGDLYTAPDGSKGVVYYVLPDGTGAWAVALNDASDTCAWGNLVDVPGLANQDVANQQMLLYDTSGYANTQVLRDFQNNNTYAAGMVDFDNGWCLPSPAQLRMLHSRMPLVAGAVIAAGGSYMAKDWYWTSAEQDGTTAWQVDFGKYPYHGRFYPAVKTSKCHVRAVRCISYGPTYVWSTGTTGPAITVSPEQTTAYTVTASTSIGCSDSANQLITVLHYDTTHLYETACDSYLWYGDSLIQSGAYPHTLTATTGCDSVVTLHLTVNHSTAQTVTINIVENDLPYPFLDTTFYEAGTYVLTLENAAGCDSVLTVVLNVFENVSNAVDSLICEGDLPIVWNEVEFTQAGTQPAVLTAANGADSVVVMTVTLIPTTYGTFDTAVVENDLPLHYHNLTCDSAGTYLDTLVSATGCDSILTLNLTVYPNVSATAYDTVCEGELPFTWNDSVFMAAGVKTTTILAHTGADSTVTMNLSVIPTTYGTVDITVVENDLPFHLHNLTCNTEGVYVDTLVNAAGCDSILTLNLAVWPNVTSELDSVVCEGYFPITWNDSVFTEAGVKTTTILAHTGADSTITMTVTVSPTTYGMVNLAVVENMLPYTYNDSTYTGAGTYIQNLTNVVGCDSVLAVVITVYENVTSLDDSTVCESELPLVWNGVEFTQAGSQSAVLTAFSGADSVVVMTLTVLPTTYGTVETAVVENDLPFHLHNLTCDSAGVYTDTIVNAAGCDSVLTLTLTVWPNVTSALDSTVCEGELPITWNDSVFTAAGVKTTTILAHTGADSTITMTLSVIPTTHGTVDAAVVENDLPFHLHNLTCNTAGVYVDTLVNAAGCDSILTLNLTVYPNVTSELDSAVCEGDFPITWNDSVFTEVGVKTTTILAQTGADSTITMTVTAIPLPVLSHTLDTVIINGTSATLWASGADYLYWTDGNGSILSSGSSLTVSPQTTTIYYLTGQNGNPAVGDNLVVNGDFEAGNTGFSSAYTYVTLQSQYHNYGRYYIIQDGHLVWGPSNLLGHGGSGLFMLVDGATTPNSVIWQQTVEVTPNTYYAFSAQIASTGYSNMYSSYAWLQFSINGTQLGPVFHSPSVLNSWQQYYEVWYSGNNTSATLTLLNQNTTADGNDFGLDDISFFPLPECSVTDSILVAVIGYPDNVDSADCVFFPEGTEWGIGQPMVSSAGAITVSTPMVGDIDDDGQQEIVCLSGNSSISSTINIFNADATLKSQFSTSSYYIWNSIGLAKVKWQENEYKNIIVVLGTNKRLYAYDAQGTQLWQSNAIFGTQYNESTPLPSISFADFNHDGWTEIYIGADIYDAATGVLLSRATANKGYSGRTWDTQINVYHTIAADLCGDYNLELAAGNTVYAVDIQSRTDFSANQMTVVREVPSSAMKMEDNSPIPFTDGNTYLADMNLDGRLDVLVMNVDQSNRVLYLYVWDIETQSIICSKKIGNTRKFGTPQIGDINQDGYDEICFITGTYSAHSTGSNDLIYALRYNPQNSNGALDVFWTTPHSDNSACTGLTLFDFNQDGIAELVYRDRFNLRIINGSLVHHQTGAALTQPYDMAVSPCGSATGIEYPLVVDVDLDGEAEIVVGGSTIETDFGQLYIFKSAGVPWAPARKVWNQYMYNVTNVNEDLTIPQYLFNNATAFTDPEGVVRRPFNNFLQQATTIDQYGRPFYAVPDVATGTSASLQMSDDTFALAFSYCNLGDIALNAPYTITVFANIYGGDTVCTVTVDESLPVDSCTQGYIQLPLGSLCGFQTLDSLVVAVNCAGTGIAQNGGLQPECDTTNNTVAVAVSLPTDTTHLFETACDSYFWYGDSLVQSGVYPHTLTATTGCDSVVMLHLTVNQSTAQTLPITIVENDLPYPFLDTTFYEAGTYELTLENAAGCDSILTVHLTVYSNVTSELDSAVCESDFPFTWNDSVFTAAGVKTTTIPARTGADSTITMTVTLVPTTYGTVDMSVVENDLPFHLHNLTCDTAGVYTDTIVNAAGCDSVLTLNLTVFYNVTEHRDSTICNSELPFEWNGVAFTAAGTDSVTLTSATGADSVVVMTVHVYPVTEFHISGPGVMCTDSSVILTADSAASYLWSTGETTQSIAVDSVGYYSVSAIDSNGCTVTADHYVTVIYDPIIEVNVDTTMCVGGTYTVTVGYQPGSSILLGDRVTTLSMVETIFLPDGTSCDPYGCSYQSPLTFTAYAPGDTIESADDIYYVRLNMEHSWIGDLYINITCPNGQKADLLKYGGSGTSECNSLIAPSSRGWQDGGTNMATGTFLGNAYDYSVNVCNANAFGNEPGQGWNYCWSDNTTQGYTYAPGAGSLIYRSVNQHYGTVDSSNVAAGTQFYHPDDSFSNLIGCPLNGSWYIEVMDGWSDDNGYIFGWELALSSEALPEATFTFDHSTAQGPWVTAVSDSMFLIQPPADLDHDTTIVYTFTVYDTSGCSVDTSVAITFLTSVYTEKDTAVCESFLWNGVTYTAAGQYQQTFANSNGCDSVVTVHLTVNLPTTATVYASTTQNALPYHYVNGQIDTTFGVGTPMLSTSQFMLSNSNGCDSLVTLILTVYPNVTTSVDTTVCAANMPFTWHGHMFTAAGSHSVTLQTSHGADSTVTYTLSVDNIAATVGNVTHVTCYGASTGAATVTVSGGQTPLSCQWTNAAGTTVSTSSSISNRPAGTYTFTVTDHRGCTATATVTINTLNGELIPGTIAASQEVCDGEDIAPFTGSAASGGDNGHYQWQISTNGTDWTNAPGTSTTQGYTYPNAASNAFTLRRAWVSQSCGTVYSNEVTVSVWPNSSDTITASVCQGEIYNDNGFNVTADETAEAGVFTYEQHHATGHCDSAVILLLTVNPVTTELVEATVCEGEGYQENGFNVAPQETIGHDEVTRTLNLQSGQGCDSTVTLHLSVIDTTLRLVMLTEDFCEHQEASLSVVSEMPDYVWSTGETATTIVVTSPGLYSVTASEGGCSATASIRVEACHYELVLPNAITPSRGDGLNDCFFIPESYTGDMVLFTIHIYNRWGELVFHSTDKNFRWNGEYRGQTQIQTVYNYVIEYTDSAGRPHRMVGSLTIL